MDTRFVLALVVPCPAAQLDSVYRVLASLSLQDDRRFVVYAFFEEGDTAMRNLLEDHADGGLDLLLRPVPALPGEDLPLQERCDFYVRQLRDETFVSFSDGKTLYGPGCIAAFHKKAGGKRVLSQFNWQFTAQPQPRLTTCWRHSVRVLLGWEQLPLCARVFRMEELDRLLSEDEATAD